MKILLLIDSLAPGGMERRLIELIKGLKKYPEFELNLVVFSDNIHYQEIYNLDIKLNILKRVPKRNPLVFYRLFKLCRRWKPNIMHSWGTMSAIWAIPSAKLLNIKLINGNIADAPKDLGFFDKRFFRAKLTFPFSDAIVGNSRAGLEAYAVPKKKRICIYNGFDNNRISNLKNISEVRDFYDIRTKYIVGMVGSFSERKDFETFINAALIVLKLRRDITFIAVGDGPNLLKCKDMVPLDYTSRFKFTGLLSDVESIINVFDIGVLSTNTQKHGEGISNAILEYMALEKPTVATSGGGTNEVIDNMKTGILIPPFAPEIMAEKLNYLLNNPNEKSEMGIEAKRKVNSVFSLHKMTAEYIKLYRDHFI